MSNKIIGYPYQVVMKGSEETYVPFRWEKGQKEQYETISLKIWGCIPHDVNWAINTKLFKDEVQV